MKLKRSNKTISCLAGIIFLILLAQTSFAQTKEQIAHKRKWDTPAGADSLTNPVAHNAAAIDEGKVIYQKYCSVCHGNTGKGDGIAAAGLSVKPADHTSNNVQEHADGSLFFELTNGHAPMPPFKTVLTEKQRWSVVSYMRTLKPKAKSKN